MLHWWKANAGSFKCLSILARKYLCVAATSVASERVFSTSGNIVSAKRNRLSPETSGVYSIMSMKQLASSEKLGGIEKRCIFWLLRGNFFWGLNLYFDAANLRCKTNLETLYMFGVMKSNVTTFKFYR